MEGEEVCRTLLREIWVGLDGIPRQSSRSHLGSNRHPLPENAAPLMDNTCDLNHQLVSVDSGTLSTILWPPKAANRVGKRQSLFA